MIKFQRVFVALSALLILLFVAASGLFCVKIYRNFRETNNILRKIQEKGINEDSVTVRDPVLSDTLSGADVQIYIDGRRLRLDMTATGTAINSDSLKTEFANVVTNKTKDKDIKIFIDGEPLIGSLPVQIGTLDKNKYINITIEKKDACRTYKLQTLPESFPKTVLTGRSPYPGDYYSDHMNTRGDSYIYKMDNDGKLLFYLKEACSDYGVLINFQKHKLTGGRVFYSYFRPQLNTRMINEPAVLQGSIVLLDASYNQVRELEMEKTPLLPEGGPVENHDFIMLGENHYLFTASPIRTIYVEHLGRYSRVRENYIQEVKDGSVVFEWISSSNKDFLKNTNKSGWDNKNNLAVDYMHINSIFIDPKDSNVIASFREQNAIIKIDRKTGTLLWILGGKGDQFGLNKDQLFSMQHFARYTEDGSILFYDNGNDKKQSRIIKMVLDEKNKKVVDFKSFQMDGMFGAYCGSVQQLENGKNVYLINWGGGEGKGCSMAIEIDFDSKKALAEIISDHNTANYRTVKEQ